MDGGYDRLYIGFLRCFNLERDYYTCHDLMEELWLEEGRNPLFQGLLQAAVGLYHHDNGNYGGAVKLLEAALSKLRLYPDLILGIHLARFRSDIEAYLMRLQQAAEEQTSLAPYEVTIRITDPLLEELIRA
ncbi:DUF309 domain-containing protein [Paenibacillus gansuensis]|uniref:DUF309 domain-containing protein n=1 Tax=Paenibacillus gansuensis TaxID=306542 RepID=A0ABW5PCZ0_9BACL